MIGFSFAAYVAMSDEAVRQNIEIYDTLRFQLVNHILILVSF